MAEQERPGEAEAIRNGRFTEEDDAEGHAYPGRVEDGDEVAESSADADDTAGHAYRPGR